MKKLFIIANWKSNKLSTEANEWLSAFSSFTFPTREEKEVIVCPPFTLLSSMQALIANKNMPIALGAQDASPFNEGAFTGEVNAGQIKEFATHAIIGHSERRKEFGETDDLLLKKTTKNLEAGLLPIFCVQKDDTPVPQGVSIVAYEPVFAIGSGTPDTPENAEQVARTIKEKTGVQYVIYGGSVTGDNVNSFTSREAIDGVLVGGASLDAEKFMQIIKNS